MLVRMLVQGVIAALLMGASSAVYAVLVAQP